MVQSESMWDLQRIPPEVIQVLTSFHTCEFSTIPKIGIPAAWPLFAHFDRGSEVFVLTTSIGLPSKAFNILRNPRVGLFYSDPTGSRLDNPPFVLVHGDATVQESVVSTEGLEDYWLALMTKQPASRIYSLRPVRPFMAWYYMRLRIEVHPRRLIWWSR